MILLYVKINVTITKISDLNITKIKRHFYTNTKPHLLPHPFWKWNGLRSALLQCLKH